MAGKIDISELEKNVMANLYSPYPPIDSYEIPLSHSHILDLEEAFKEHPSLKLNITYRRRFSLNCELIHFIFGGKYYAVFTRLNGGDK